MKHKSNEQQKELSQCEPMHTSTESKKKFTDIREILLMAHKIIATLLFPRSKSDFCHHR